MKTNKVIAKYLATYAEDISPWLVNFPHHYRFERCVVIPAFDEPPSFTNHLLNIAPSHTLAIVILNCAEDCQKTQKITTKLAKQHLARHGTVVWSSPIEDTLQLIQTDIPNKNDTLHWLIWDISDWQTSNGHNDTLGASHSQIASFNYGVGYARKLGMDCALRFYSLQQINNPFFLSTDADAILPDEYFSELQINKPEYMSLMLSTTPNKIAGYIFPFHHSAVKSNTNSHSQFASTAALLYEVSLRYYVLALRWAKSPWGFHTIGSTIAIHAFHYAANRGFPKREAGEDFYLLNKIAKTGQVLSIKQPYITLSDRASHRVPFGTGPAIKRIQHLSSIPNDFLLYHPTSFQWLSECLSAIPKLHEQSIEDIFQSPEIVDILNILNIRKAITHSRKQSKSQQEFHHHMLIWFDAFKTLKFIHIARDKYLGSLSLETWINWIRDQKIPFLPSIQLEPIDNLSATNIQHLALYIRDLDTQTLPFVSYARSPTEQDQ